ncbi:hypothetical protein [Paraferrimonas sedimenticola]|uniref:Outer membrane protein n=1 Tax=Paraferrimonas sedimenticola TaxID=375674 RepID=A0AA37RV60_9GAMM|nr:hypothetical protein [Paraferrimonas sedimenticola]GLP95402.1 hypothetical protein GCM10007895_07080 [Paraferrimonas sedimenticola]
MRAKSIALLISLLAAGSMSAQANDWEFDANLGWDNKYVSEGRNNLDKGGIVWGHVGASKNGFNLFADVGRGDQEHYIEYNIGASYAFEVESLGVEAGYMRVEEYPDRPASYGEYFLNLDYSRFAWLTPTVNYLYHDKNKGSFLTVGLESAWDLTERLSFTPYAAQSWDYGYALENFSGENNFQFGVNLDYEVNANWSINANLNRSIAGESIKQERIREGKDFAEINQTFGGVYVNYTF